MRVLVTGATGFIGNHVIESLLKKEGLEIIASSKSEKRAETYDWYKKVTYVPWTIGQAIPEDLLSYFKNPDLCIHLAWDGLPDFRNPEHESEYFKNHLLFLKSLIQQGIRKLAITGTCLEYGMKEGELNEKMPAEPTLAYPIGKNKLRIALEELQKQHNFQLDWIRLFYMYGEGQSPKSILAQLERHIEEKKPVFNMSGGEQVRDYLPVEKIAEVIVNLALLNSGNGIVNCCSGKPITILNLVKDFLEKHQADIELNLGFYPYPDYEPFKFWGSTEKLNTLLNTK